MRDHSSAARLATNAAWLPSLAALVAGTVMRQCALLSAAGPLALAAFYVTMDLNAPQDGFRVAVRCAVAGLVSMLGALGLAAVAAAAIFGVWHPDHDRTMAAIAVVAGATAFLVMAMGSGELRAEARNVTQLASVAVPLGLIAAWLYDASEWSQCGLLVASAILMAGAGWRLLRDVASELLAAGVRR
ncbi:MAG: hypothetical protein KIS74_00735 [Burkholderiales bacterium]|nr:hypothetical protein [Burkholderiales bacterium]